MLGDDPGVTVDLLGTKTQLVSLQPYKATELVGAIARLTGKACPFAKDDIAESTRNTDEPVAVPAVADAEREGKLILVAEDQPTNREVIRRQLNKLGYCCVMAENGRKALNTWRLHRFGLLLTDCHMPEMDGFQLTSEIRNAEAVGEKTHPMPIIAITANALVGEAENCLSAGMDDYLSKPVELIKLEKTLSKWLNGHPMPKERRVSESQSNSDRKLTEVTNSGPVIDLASLATMLGTEDNTILSDILTTFWQSMDDNIVTIEASILDKNARELRDVVHAAKGSAKSVAAEKLAAHFFLLQQAAENESWVDIPELYQLITRELEQIDNFLSQMDRRHQ